MNNKAIETNASAANIGGITRKATVTKSELGATWEFANGKVLALNVDQLNNAVKVAALVHGLVQMVSDTYSGIKDAGEAYEAANAKVEALLRGELTVKREGTGGLLAQAIANLMGIELEVVVAKLQAGGEAAKKKASADIRVKAEVARLQAEALAKKANSAEEAFTF